MFHEISIVFFLLLTRFWKKMLNCVWFVGVADRGASIFCGLSKISFLIDKIFPFLSKHFSSEKRFNLFWIPKSDWCFSTQYTQYSTLYSQVPRKKCLFRISYDYFSLNGMPNCRYDKKNFVNEKTGMKSKSILYKLSKHGTRKVPINAVLVGRLNDTSYWDAIQGILRIYFPVMAFQYSVNHLLFQLLTELLSLT